MTLAALEREKGHPLMLGKLLHYLGIHLLMATLQRWALSKFWDYRGTARPQEDGPHLYNLQNYMTYTHFKHTTLCLIFISAKPPTLK
jgi:hypothetical protein